MMLWFLHDICSLYMKILVVVVETVLKTPLHLDGATLTTWPKSNTFSRHQTTRETGSRKEHESTSQGNDTDSKMSVTIDKNNNTSIDN